MKRGDVVFGICIVGTEADARWVEENCTVHGLIQVRATGRTYHPQPKED